MESLPTGQAEVIKLGTPNRLEVECRHRYFPRGALPRLGETRSTVRSSGTSPEMVELESRILGTVLRGGSLPKAMALVDYGKCQPERCPSGLCRSVEACPKGILSQEAPFEMPDPYPSMCLGCGICASACPAGAVRLV
jgi:ferredoxin